MEPLFENLHTGLSARPEDIKGVLKALQSGKQLSPLDIASKSKLTLTAVKCAVQELFRQKLIRIEERDTSPKLVVFLKTKGKRKSESDSR